MCSQFNHPTEARHRIVIMVGLGIGVLACLASGSALGVSYTVTDVGTLGGDVSDPQAMNEKGQVVGQSTATPGGGFHAFVWTTTDGMRDLGTLGGTESFANAINDEGLVVGYSTTTSGSDHVFLWTPASGMEDLGTLGLVEREQPV